MVITDIRPLIAVAIPLAACLVIFLTGRKQNLRDVFSPLAAIITAIVVFSMAFGVRDGQVYEFVLCSLTHRVDLALRADAAGILFACVSSFLYIPVSFYAIGYMRGHKEQNQTGFYAFFAMCIFSAVGIAFSANLLTFFVFFEILTMATWPLIFHERSDDAKFSGRKYLIYTLIPGQLFLVGILIVFFMCGKLDFVAGGYLNSAMASKGALIALFFLLVGAGAVKAGMMPLHGWLPSAMIAPTPVSALLHAVAVVKAGAFCVIRITGYVYGPELLKEIGAARILSWIAVATILCSSLIAINQDNLKRRLAYSTIGQLSYVILGACLLTPQGFQGALFHIVAHALMKITLFMCAGAIIVTTHKNNISEMKGIGRQMPVTMICFTIGSLGIIGIPFIIGFVSKWNLAIGALQAEQPWYIVVLLTSALLSVIYLMPLTYTAFFTHNDNGDFQKRKEASLWMLIPICVTAVLSILLGIIPNFGLHLYDLARMAAESIMH